MAEPNIPSRAAKYTLVVNKFSTFDFKWRWRTGGDTPTNISLVGAKSLMQVRATERDDNVLFEASSWNGKISLGNETGLVSLFLTTKDTSEMQFGEGFYDWLVTLSNGRTHRVLEGKFYVLNGITKMPE